MKNLQAECAAKIVEVVPSAMRYIRESIRSQQPFTVPQWRVLVFLHFRDYATLSDLAAHQGVSLPTMSKLVAGLVQRKLLRREGDGNDKRKLRLQLTPEGAKAYDMTLEGTRRYVAEKLAHLESAEQQKLGEAMDLLQAMFNQ